MTVGCGIQKIFLEQENNGCSFPQGLFNSQQWNVASKSLKEMTKNLVNLAMNNHKTDTFFLTM